MTKRANVLTVSLIAIFAVTSVRAEIASKAYVDQQVDSVEAKVDTHTANTTMHITAAERTAWNAKQDAVPAGTSGNIVTYSGTEGTFGSKTFVNTAVYSPEAEEINAVAIPSVALVEEIAAYAAGDYVPLNQSTAQNTNADKAMITDNNGRVTTGQIATGMIANKAVTNDKLSDAVNASLDLADSAVQPAAISDMETKTHAAATYQAKALVTNFTDADDTHYPSAKAVDTAIKAATSAASSGAADALQDAKDYADGKFQIKSTKASIGGANGTWTELTDAQLAAMNSGVKAADVTQITTNKNDIAKLNGDATTTGSVAKSIADAITALNLANTYDAKGSAATAKSEAIAAAATDATSKANAAEAAAKAYANDTFQPISEKATDLSGNFADDTKYPSAKAVKAAIAAASSSAASSYQAKSTADLQIGTTGGVFRDMTKAEKDALASGIDSTKVAQIQTNATNIGTNTGNIATLMGADTVTGSVAKAEKDAKAYADSLAGNYATSAQGAKADTAVQPGDIAQTYDGTSAAAMSGKAVAAAIQDAGGQTAQQVATAINTKVGTLNGVVNGSGNVVKAVTEADGIVTATKGNAFDKIGTATGSGNVITAISKNADGQTIDVVMDITAIPKPSGTCTDCVLHYAGATQEFSWEEVGR